MKDKRDIGDGQGEIECVLKNAVLRDGVCTPAILEHEGIRAGPACERVIPESAIEHVIAFTAVDIIGSFVTPNNIIVTISPQGVIMYRTIDIFDTCQFIFIAEPVISQTVQFHINSRGIALVGNGVAFFTMVSTYNDVIAFAAFQKVVSGSSIQGVVSGSATQYII